MPRLAFVKNGFIVNVAGYSPGEPALNPGESWFVLEDGDTRNVGTAVDAKDLVFDRQDAAIHRILFQLVNDVRTLKGQATITAAQYRNYVKGLIA